MRRSCARRSRRSIGASSGAKVARENVIVTAGAKQAVFNVCQALFEEGDEVALFAPYWVSFPEMVRLTGASPVFVPTTLATGGTPRPTRSRAHASESVRGVILNSPNNPTGAVVDAGGAVAASSTGATPGASG